MLNIDNWEDIPAAQARENSGLLPEDEYVLEVKKALIKKSANSGKDCLVLELDIAKGKYKNYYSDKFKVDKAFSNTAKWRCCYYQTLEETRLPYFKGLIESFEESNSGFEWKR